MYYICVCLCGSDTMVCTGCCSSLDHIVTYLFKQLSRSTKKRPTPMATDDRFLHIMQQHPEMIQQVRRCAPPFLSDTGCDANMSADAVRSKWFFSLPVTEEWRRHTLIILCSFVHI